MSGKTLTVAATRLDERPMLRYAAGATLIMALAVATGNPIAYIIPLLALSFLGPAAPAPTLARGGIFVLLVALTTGAGLFFTQYFYEYPLFFIPLLALILLWIFYTGALPFTTKLFLLISFLVMPVPPPGMSAALWAYALNRVLVGGAVFTIVMVWTVWALFPGGEGGGAAEAPAAPARLRQAVRTLVVTFPVVLAFLFFRWSNALLVLIYIAVLAMLPSGGRAGIAMLLGNLLGGAATLLFYGLLLIVPNLFFFLLLYLATALFFSRHIFSEKTAAPLYKTAFSTLTLLIGGAVMGGDSAGTGTLVRIVQVFIAVVYVVGANAFLDHMKRMPLVQRLGRGSRPTPTTETNAS